MHFKITSRKHGDFESSDSLEVANRIHANDSVQVRIAWADRYYEMAPGERRNLIDGLGNTTIVERVA